MNNIVFNLLIYLCFPVQELKSYFPRKRLSERNEEHHIRYCYHDFTGTDKWSGKTESGWPEPKNSSALHVSLKHPPLLLSATRSAVLHRSEADMGFDSIDDHRYDEAWWGFVFSSEACINRSRGSGVTKNRRTFSITKKKINKIRS